MRKNNSPLHLTRGLYFFVAEIYVEARPDDYHRPRTFLSFRESGACVKRSVLVNWILTTATIRDDLKQSRRRAGFEREYRINVAINASGLALFFFVTYEPVR